MDLQGFIATHRPSWERLESLLLRMERQGVRHLSLEHVQELGRLYRETSADLLRARSHSASADLIDYLNDLVARAHGQIHPGRRPRLRDVGRFYAVSFPRLVRAEWRAIALSAAFLFAGAAFGAGAMAFDPDAWIYLVPEQHQRLDPDERIQDDSGKVMDPGGQAAFSAFLFTHNIQVTILVFAVGIFAGVLTGILMFMNGVLLGALGWVYHSKGHALFFWAWIMPHGALELSAIFIAGGAGFVLGRAVLAPGRYGRADALREAGGRAVRIILGIVPVLVVAGLIEGTVSQWHAPTISPWLKLLIAFVGGSLLWLWLLRAGRGAQESADAGAHA